MRNVKLVRLGLVPYLEAKDLQLDVRDRVREGIADGVLITLQHPPVYTVGRSGGFQNILVPRERLEKIAEIHEVERGGNITFHGPGQIVAYPILNLNEWERDVHLYVNRLEEVVIRLLKDYGILAGRKDKYTGVWVKDEKICAIGVAVRQWITWHGMALNVNTDLNYFNLINPCGITEFGVTSLEKLGVNKNIQDVLNKFIDKFGEVFETKIEESTLQALEVS